MVRSAVIKMETDMSQEEFETWLLKTIRNIAVYPAKSEVLSTSDQETSILPDCPWYGNCGARLVIGEDRKCRRKEGVCSDKI